MRIYDTRARPQIIQIRFMQTSVCSAERPLAINLNLGSILFDGLRNAARIIWTIDMQWLDMIDGVIVFGACESHGSVIRVDSAYQKYIYIYMY